MPVVIRVKGAVCDLFDTLFQRMGTNNFHCLTVIECMLMSTDKEADTDFENIPCMILTIILGTTLGTALNFCIKIQIDLFGAQYTV